MIILKKYNDFQINEAKKDIILYHGSDIKFNKFDTKFISTDYHKWSLGPGLYFTYKEPGVAKGWGKYLYTCRLKKDAKIVSNTKKATVAELTKITKANPYWKDAIGNFGEHNGWSIYMDMLKNYSNANHQFIEGVWGEIYKGQPSLFANKMVEVLGYDGIYYPPKFKSPTGYERADSHIYLIWNPDAIEILKIEQT